MQPWLHVYMPLPLVPLPACLYMPNPFFQTLQAVSFPFPPSNITLLAPENEAVLAAVRLLQSMEMGTDAIAITNVSLLYDPFAGASPIRREILGYFYCNGACLVKHPCTCTRLSSPPPPAPPTPTPPP
jgi:hypothetical protein